MNNLPRRKTGRDTIEEALEAEFPGTLASLERDRRTTIEQYRTWRRWPRWRRWLWFMTGRHWSEIDIQHGDDLLRETAPS